MTESNAQNILITQAQSKLLEATTAYEQSLFTKATDLAAEALEALEKALGDEQNTNPLLIQYYLKLADYAFTEERNTWDNLLKAKHSFLTSSTTEHVVKTEGQKSLYTTLPIVNMSMQEVLSMPLVPQDKATVPVVAPIDEKMIPAANEKKQEASKEKVTIEEIKGDIPKETSASEEEEDNQQKKSDAYQYIMESLDFAQGVAEHWIKEDKKYNEVKFDILMKKMEVSLYYEDKFQLKVDANDLLQLVQTVHLSRKVGNAYFLIGLNYIFFGDYSQSKECFEKSISILGSLLQNTEVKENDEIKGVIAEIQAKVDEIEKILTTKSKACSNNATPIILPVKRLPEDVNVECHEAKKKEC